MSRLGLVGAKDEPRETNVLGEGGGPPSGPPGGHRARIPFNRVTLAGLELAYVREAVELELQTAGDGKFTALCESTLKLELGAAAVLLTTSCTHALEMAALLLEIGPGDEVIVPTFTFVSTANAFFLRGARPVLVDSRPDTLNLDERLLRPLLGPRTRAIVPVHYAGVGCAMDEIQSLALEARVAVVEDNAHGLFGAYRGRPLGSFGRLAAQSFHQTKNLSCGEGGALVINDPELCERATILRDKGTDRHRFLRGEVDRYTWVDIGSSYLPSEILAAYLYGQLERRTNIQEQRRQLWELYAGALRDWADRNGVGLPQVPPECRQSYHMFFLVMPDHEGQRAMIAHLRERSIYAVFHYVPLHLSQVGARLGYRRGDFPVAEGLSERLVRLPFYPCMPPEDSAVVIDAVLRFNR